MSEALPIRLLHVHAPSMPNSAVFYEMLKQTIEGLREFMENMGSVTIGVQYSSDPALKDKPDMYEVSLMAKEETLNSIQKLFSHECFDNMSLQKEHRFSPDNSYCDTEKPTRYESPYSVN